MTAVADVHVRVPAKVNLALSVGPPGDDGFHELATVFHAVSLYDDLVAAPADEIGVEVVGAGADQVPADGTNLAVRAALLLADRAGVSEGVALRVTKGIPVAGGMAGGSADAAAALLACDVLWRTGLAREELRELCGELGCRRPVLARGRHRRRHRPRRPGDPRTGARRVPLGAGPGRGGTVDPGGVRRVRPAAGGP